MEKNRYKNAMALRQTAEIQTLKKAVQEPKNLSSLPLAIIYEGFNELRVNQIELDMLKKELRSARAEKNAAQAKLSDFYDLAPAGYMTLGKNMRILAANRTIATLLGRHKKQLTGQKFFQLICKEDQDIFNLHHSQLFTSKEPQRSELRMVKNDGTLLWVCLDSIFAAGEEGGPACRMVLSDITERKQAERKHKDECLRRMAGAVAHHFNNQLTVVMGSLTSLKKSFLTLIFLIPAPSFMLTKTRYIRF